MFSGHVAPLHVGRPLLSRLIAMTADIDHHQQPMKPHHAAALVAGTSVGGGFLALPSVTAPIGFPVAATSMCAIWILLIVAALAYAEGASRVLKDRVSSAASTEGVSIASFSRAAFGSRVSSLCTLAFVAQILAMVTAQLVKTAEIAAAVSAGALPYRIGCILPALLFGVFTLRAPAIVVERANTALTASIVGGFIVLCRNVAAGGTSCGSRLAIANWEPLLCPLAGGSTWPLPVFLSVLQFGAAIPVIVQGMQAHRSPLHAQRMRGALVAGAALPLVLGLLWTGVTTSQPPLSGRVAATGAEDPVLALLLGRRPIALPAQALSAGAIGSTLIGAYLTLRQLFADTLPHRKAQAATAVAVVGPALVGMLGPSLYLPLLSLSGAFPCTILYVLVPLLALRALRAAGVGGEDEEDEWLPGGSAGLLAFSALPVSMLATSGATLGGSAVRLLSRLLLKLGWTGAGAAGARNALKRLLVLLKARLFW
jgi:tyrosine-specific transport protein